MVLKNKFEYFPPHSGYWKIGILVKCYLNERTSSDVTMNAKLDPGGGERRKKHNLLQIIEEDSRQTY